jgi:hypothetical protein
MKEMIQRAHEREEATAKEITANTLPEIEERYISPQQSP